MKKIGLGLVALICVYTLAKSAFRTSSKEQIEREERAAAQNYMLNNALRQCQIQLTESQKQLTYAIQMSETFRNQ